MEECNLDPILGPVTTDALCGTSLSLSQRQPVVLALHHQSMIENMDLVSEQRYCTMGEEAKPGVAFDL